MRTCAKDTSASRLQQLGADNVRAVVQDTASTADSDLGGTAVAARAILRARVAVAAQVAAVNPHVAYFDEVNIKDGPERAEASPLPFSPQPVPQLLRMIQ